MSGEAVIKGELALASTILLQDQCLPRLITARADAAATRRMPRRTPQEFGPDDGRQLEAVGALAESSSNRLHSDWIETAGPGGARLAVEKAIFQLT
jgi:hypothetical protein